MIRSVHRNSGFALLAMFVVLAAPSGAEYVVENCTNGIDDNGNGLIDCADKECGKEEVCSFGNGCCILQGCFEDASAVPQIDEFLGAVCLEELDPADCAQPVVRQVTDGGAARLPMIPDIECDSGQLVPGQCAAQPACPQFAAGHSAPVLSRSALTVLALLLAVAGGILLKRRAA